MTVDTEPPKAKHQNSGLGLRLVSACIMIPPVLGAIYFGSPYFEALVVLGVIVMAWEWLNLCDRKPLWLVGGALYIGAASFSLIHMRAYPEFGFESVVWVFVLVWAADSGAYAAGRAIGGPKLAPNISPNKTWAGLIGGVSAAGVIGFLGSLALNHENVIPLILISAILGVLSQMGDLLESWVKRKFNKKDAGKIIPGHGGVLDRVDGLLAAALGAAAIGFMSKGSALTWG